jgi:protein gp37
MDISNIEWTDATWNPWMGCEHVSPGCDNCYMFTDMRRYGSNPEAIRRSKTKFKDPLKWARNRQRYGHINKIFTCSWSDFFITDADEWRDDAWNIIRRTPMLTYQVLTKRPVLIRRRLPSDWGYGWPNCWLGVTVESRAYLGASTCFAAYLPPCASSASSRCWRTSAESTSADFIGRSSAENLDPSGAHAK